MSDRHRGDRPRLLIPVTMHFGIRYAVRTGLVQRLQAVCQPVVGLYWSDDALTAELAAEGIDVVVLPKSAIGSGLARALAAVRWSFERRLGSPSTAIHRRRFGVRRSRRARMRRTYDHLRYALRALLPGSAERAEHRLAGLVDSESNVGSLVELLQRSRIDALLSITPFVPQELATLVAAAHLGLPRCTSILSFDNITSRPPLPITFDRYLVWNRFNAAELLRAYPAIQGNQVQIVGPAQFDFYADPEMVLDEQTWRALHGIEAEQPVVLYGAGPSEIAPHEPQFVAHLCDGIDDGRLPRSTCILVRRHPVDRPDRWTAVARHPSVVFQDPWQAVLDRRSIEVDMSMEEIRLLCSTLAHTDVHVNVGSTMTLDGAFFDKPQVGPAYDESPGRPYARVSTDLYRTEHLAPIVGSGGLALASSSAELVDLVAAALADPPAGREARREMLREVCTFTDGACTDRVAAAVTEFLVGAGLTSGARCDT